MLCIGTTVLGVNDLRRAMASRTQALGHVSRQERDTWVVLVPPFGAGAHVALGLSESPAQPHATDQVAEVERLLGLGAQRVDRDRYPPRPDFVVLADTEGNRCRVVDTGGHPAP